MTIVLLCLLLGISSGYYVVVRFITLNFHTVVEGQVYRSAQPSAALIERLHRDVGLRSILNLRPMQETDLAEDELAKRLGVRMLHLPLPNARLPSKIELQLLLDAIEHAPRPMLIHCKNGADRTGFASALAAMHAGVAPDRALAEQLCIARLHTGTIGPDIAELFDYLNMDKAHADWSQLRTIATSQRWPGDDYRASSWIVARQGAAAAWAP